MRWRNHGEDRLSPEEVAALARRIASDEPTDATTAAVFRLEAHIRQLVRDEVALAADPSEKIAAALGHELSRLTSELERGMHAVSVAIMRKR